MNRSLCKGRKSLHKKIRRGRKSGRKSGLKGRKGRKSGRKGRKGRKLRHGFGITIDGIVANPISNDGVITTFSKNPVKRTIQKTINKFNQLKHKFNTLPPVVLSLSTILLLLLIYLYMGNEIPSLKSLYEKLGNYILGSSVVTQYMLKDAAYKLGTDVKKYLTSDEEPKNVKKMDNINNILDQSDVEFKVLYDKGYITSGYHSFYKVLRYQLSSSSNDPSNKEFINIVDQLNFIMKLANITGNPTVAHSIQTDTIITLVNDLDELLSSYSNVYDKLETSVINPLVLVLSDIDKSKIPPFSSIFLVGNPGVGKTYFVNSLIEKLKKAVDGKVERIDINLKNLTAISGNNTGGYSHSTGPLIVKDMNDFFSKLHPFTKSIVNESIYKIVFIDEIDKILKSNSGYILLEFLLSLLGSSVGDRKYYDNVIGDMIIPKDVLIIAASNMSLEELTASMAQMNPLKSRFIEIHIPDLTKEMQIRLTAKYLDDLYSKIGRIADSDDYDFICDLVYDTDLSGVRELHTYMNIYVQQILIYDKLKSYKKMKDPTIIREKLLETFTNGKYIKNENNDDDSEDEKSEKNEEEYKY